MRKIRWFFVPLILLLVMLPLTTAFGGEQPARTLKPSQATPTVMAGAVVPTAVGEEK